MIITIICSGWNDFIRRIISFCTRWMFYPLPRQCLALGHKWNWWNTADITLVTYCAVSMNCTFLPLLENSLFLHVALRLLTPSCSPYCRILFPAFIPATTLPFNSFTCHLDFASFSTAIVIRHNVCVCVCVLYVCTFNEYLRLTVHIYDLVLCNCV